jgi:hypothetical protein
MAGLGQNLLIVVLLDPHPHPGASLRAGGNPLFVRLFLCAGLSAAIVTAGEVTFSHDVAPILYRHCVGCHHAGDIAPMPLMTYTETRPWASAIREAVLTRKMPPWKADPHYGEWANDPRLSDAEIATLKAWAEGAKLEGSPKDMPPAPEFPDGWKIGKPNLVISIPEQKVEGKGPDEYTYVTVPVNATAATIDTRPRLQ